MYLCSFFVCEGGRPRRNDRNGKGQMDWVKGVEDSIENPPPPLVALE